MRAHTHTETLRESVTISTRILYQRDTERMTLQARIYTCLLLLGSSIAAKTRLRIEPQAGNIYLNEDKVFLCKADGEADDIHWFDPNDDEIEGDNERFQLQRSEYDLQLKIRRAERGDSGRYACKADTDHWGELRTTIDINVIQRVTFLTVNTSLQFDEGQDASLGCRVIGIPQPTVSWRRDGQDVRQKGHFEQRQGSLVIKAIQPSDAGVYECVGTVAQRNEKNSINISVTVNYAPMLSPPAPAEVFTWLGNPVNLSCPITSFPKAVVNWTHGGEEVGDRAGLFTVGSGHTSVSTLEVGVQSAADLGEYRCTASNRLGTVTKSIWVKEAEFPSAPENVSIEAHSTTIQVSLSKPASDGGVPILGYEVQWSSENGDRDSKVIESETSRITDLEPYTSYSFRVAARNGKGFGEFSHNVTTRTLSSREPDRPQLTVKNVSEGNTFRIYFEDSDNGGTSVLRHNIRYKAEYDRDWINITVNGSDSYLLLDLDWSTHYQVQVESVNMIGESEPTFLNFTTPRQALPIKSVSGEKSQFGTGGLVGIIMVIFVVLLVAVDVACYYTNKCGILMCIAVNVLGKPMPAAKRLEQEVGDTPIRLDMKGNLCEVMHQCSKTKNPGQTTDKMPLTKSETLPVHEKSSNQA